MPDAVDIACVELFRDAVGLRNTPRGHAMDDAALLKASFSDFEMDSLAVMEFVMFVEERFDVELDEQAVNRCRSLAEFSALVRGGMHA